MTNPELNAYINELLGNDQSQRRCTWCLHKGAICHNRPDNTCPILAWLQTERDEPLETCPYAKPITPPDYCNDGAAFLKLVEWCESKKAITHMLTNLGGWTVAFYISAEVAGFQNEATTPLPLALARAVYEATKGT